MHTSKGTALVIAVATTLSLLSVKSSAQRPQLIGTRLWSVGVESGDPTREFGQIVAAALDSSGTAYLLDAPNHIVRVIGRDGKPRPSIGRKGGGPCEFEIPKAVLHDGRDRLYVLDWLNGLAVFSTSASGAPKCLLAKKLAVTGNDFCMVDGALFGYALHDGRVVHRFTADGTLTGSFGEPIRTSGPPDLQDMFALSGRVGCVPTSKTVVVATSPGAFLQAFSASGTRVWLDSVPAFLGQVATRAGRGHTIMRGPRGLDLIASLALVDSNTLAIQITRTLNQETILTRTCLVTATVGSCPQPAVDLPLILTARGTKALIVRDPSIPTIQLVELRR